MDRMIEVAELIDRLPLAAPHVEHIGKEVATQCEDQRQCVFRYRIDRVISDIGDRDAMRLAIGLIDTVGAGGGDCDEFQLG